MTVSGDNRAREAPRVLVLAARFPSISQPWLDTYLEQLVKHEIRFRVASALDTAEPYHPKVDRLNLRELVIRFPSAPRRALLALLFSILTRPVVTLGRAYRYWKGLEIETRLQARLSAWIRSLVAASIVDRWTSLQAVHAHSIDMAYDFLPIVRESGLALLVTYHGLKPAGVPRTPDGRLRAVLGAATTTLVNTQVSISDVTARGASSSRVIVLPQAISLDDYPYAPAKPPRRGEPLRVISVGRFQREKGHEYALLALTRLKRDGYNIHWSFVGVGTELARFQSLAHRLGVEEHTSWHVGLTVEELRLKYQQSHVLVLASLNASRDTEWVETQGVVIQEAQATGCIPIATRVGGIPECISSGLDGFLIRDRSHRAIAKAIVHVLSIGDSWDSLREAGRRTVEQHFSASVIGARFVEILRDSTLRTHTRKRNSKRLS